jgi:hypothetical protein
MKKQSRSPFAFLTLRALILLLLCGAACSFVTGTLLDFFRREAQVKTSQRTFSFAERVAYQRAIEDVYWPTGSGQKNGLIPSHRWMR